MNPKSTNTKNTIPSHNKPVKDTNKEKNLSPNRHVIYIVATERMKADLSEITQARRKQGPF